MRKQRQHQHHAYAWRKMKQLQECWKSRWMKQQRPLPPTRETVDLRYCLLLLLLLLSMLLLISPSLQARSHWQQWLLEWTSVGRRKRDRYSLPMLLLLLLLVVRWRAVRVVYLLSSC